MTEMSMQKTNAIAYLVVLEDCIEASLQTSTCSVNGVPMDGLGQLG